MLTGRMHEYRQLKELSSDIRSLFAEARRVQAHAQAQCSGFLVGCALRGINGSTYAACNVETPAYNNSIHGEMGALSQMVSDGCLEFTDLVVVTNAVNPAFPCGFCRQYLSEFGTEARIFAAGKDENRIWEVSFQVLLPFQFSQDSLELPRG